LTTIASREFPGVRELDGQVIEEGLDHDSALTRLEPDHAVNHLALYATASSSQYRLGLVYWDQTDQAFMQTFFLAKPPLDN
jgi:hypothetical protein